jgi:spore cortex biosynthesis protein YabQ
MMSQVIREETIVFLMAVGHGAALSLAYDLLRALRRIVPHGTAAVSVEDFLFWIAAGFLTFCFLFLKTDGEIRGYVAVGTGLGISLYLLCFSHFVLQFLTFLFSKVKCLRRRCVRAVVRCLRRILSFSGRPFVRLGHKIAAFGRKNTKAKEKN